MTSRTTPRLTRPCGLSGMPSRGALNYCEKLTGGRQLKADFDDRRANGLRSRPVGQVSALRINGRALGRCRATIVGGTLLTANFGQWT